MMAQSIASTNARIHKARTAKLNNTIPGVEEEPQVCCDVTEAVLNEEELALNERITSQLNYEERLQQAYNFYR